MLGVLRYLAIIMLLLGSGSAYFYLYNAGITLVSFLLIALILFYASPKSKFLGNAFVWIYISLIGINALIYGLSFFIIGDIILLLGTLLITCSIDYDLFRRYFLRVTVYMVLISIVLEIMLMLHLFTPALYGAGKTDLEGHYIFAFHAFGGGHILEIHNHLCGVFWEPGIYGIVLNLALLFNLDIFNKRSAIPWRRTKLWSIILAILMTQSTTGYLVLGIIIVGLFLEKSKASIAFKLLSLVGICVFWLLAINISVIRDKFSYDNFSFLSRANNLIGLSQAVWVRPLYGLGPYTDSFDQVASQLGLTKALSAGLLLQATQLGIGWLVAYYYSLILEYRKRRVRLPLSIYLIIITALGLTEPLAFAPIMLINVLPFKKLKNG